MLATLLEGSGSFDDSGIGLDTAGEIGDEVCGGFCIVGDGCVIFGDGCVMVGDGCGAPSVFTISVDAVMVEGGTTSSGEVLFRGDTVFDPGT